MFFSAYQIESLLEDFQKNILPVDKSSSDTLSISDVAYNESRQLFRSQEDKPLGSINPEKINDLIEDKTTYDPIVDYVQQSRAGRFVSPNYIPENPAPPFPLVSDFTQSEKEEDRQKNESLFSTNHNSSDKTRIDLKEDMVNDVSSKLKNLKEKSSSDSFFKDTDNEDHLKDTISLYRKNTSRIDEDNDVVFGEGPILTNSISKFVADYPDSAIKFLLRKNLDGRPLPMEYEKIYQKWETRGLSRRNLKKYLLKLMKWEELPNIPMLEVLKIIREYLFDIRDKNNE